MRCGCDAPSNAILPGPGHYQPDKLVTRSLLDDRSRCGTVEGHDLAVEGDIIFDIARAELPRSKSEPADSAAVQLLR